MLFSSSKLTLIFHASFLLATGIDAMANNNGNNIIDHNYLERPMVALVDDSERNAAVEIEDAGVRMGMADRDNGVIEIADANDVVDGNETSADDIDGDGNEQMADKGGRSAAGGGSRSRSWSRNGAFSMRYGVVFSPVIVAIVSSFSFGVVFF
mmetsp:Transcript_34399/g.63421  ORF Transcript_34399/g.63421 Transcript_34399/m.63421 type:complete len:153 (+) Transcript_34399:198-656(+)